jgi:hypothetical protein
MLEFLKNCEKYAFSKVFYKKRKSAEFGEAAFIVAEIITKLIFCPPCFLLDKWPSS